ncbi:MAG: hypothetical protein KGL39_12115 [Patescibacteria group bacterium]|nr:hypothetical protein [Patescibacteria group bacterium]
MKLPWTKPVEPTAELRKLTQSQRTLLRGRLTEPQYPGQVDEIAAETGLSVATVYAFKQVEEAKAKRQAEEEYKKDPLGAIRREAQRAALDNAAVKEAVSKAAIDEILAPYRPQSPSGDNAWVIQLAREPNAKPLWDALATVAARAVPPDKKDEVVFKQHEMLQQQHAYIQQLEQIVRERALDLIRQPDQPAQQSAQIAAEPQPEEPPKLPAPPEEADAFGAFLLEIIQYDPQTAAQQAYARREEFPDAWKQITEHSFQEIQAALMMGMLDGMIPKQVKEFWIGAPPWLHAFLEALKSHEPE